MKDFAAIDFETANEGRSSICSVGLVVVRSGEVVDKRYCLVRPEPHYYSSFCTAVHGLRLEDTRDALDFATVWRELDVLVSGLPLVAHNASFDRGCLRAAHEVYGMVYGGYEFHCTLAASRRHYGSRLPNHQLVTVAAACGYDLRAHHHALADAEACAAIALRLL